MSRFILAAVIAVVAASVVASPVLSQTPVPPQACGARLDGAGKAITFSEPLTEEVRLGLSAGVYLALRDESGRGDWPMSEIEISSPCVIARFEADGADWELFAGEGLAPPRWAKAVGREELLFLAEGPSLEAAGAWSRIRRGAPPAGPKAYYLGGLINEILYVFKVYPEPPAPKQLVDDLHSLISQKADALAALDSTGDAVSLYLETQSRRTAVLYRPHLLNGVRKAVISGADGLYFMPTVRDGVVLQGSDTTCAKTYGLYERRNLTVLDSREERLDLACYYSRDDSNDLFAYVTLSPDAGDDRKQFKSVIDAALKETGAVRSSGGARNVRGSGASMDKFWFDRSGTGHGIWLTRRGDYVLEVRLTFATDQTDPAFDALAGLLRDFNPTEK